MVNITRKKVTTDGTEYVTITLSMILKRNCTNGTRVRHATTLYNLVV